MNKDTSRRYSQPFKPGMWVTPVDKSHPLYNKPARVESCSYETCGSCGTWMVRVRFDTVREPLDRHIWTFKQEDLVITTSREVGELGRPSDNA